MVRSGRGSANASRVLAVMALVMVYVALTAQMDSRAQVNTPTPQITATPTATVPPTATPGIDPPVVRIVDGVRFGRNEIGGIAVDRTGRVYVGNMVDQVQVFSSDLEPIRSFGAPQPFVVTISRDDTVLYVGQRSPAAISLYTVEGVFQRTLWEQQNAELETFALDSDGNGYIIFKSLTRPFAVLIVKLDVQGNLVYIRTLTERSTQATGVYGITFDRDGTLLVGLSGLDDDPVACWLVRLTPAGDWLRDRGPTFFFQYRLRPPLFPLKLSGGILVLYSLDGMGWWHPDGRLIIYRQMFELLSTNNPQADTQHSGAAALAPDGQTIVFVQIIEEYRYAIGKTRLSQQVR